MREIVRLAKFRALPFFAETKTVEGLLNCLKKADGRSDHHLNLEKGCCLAKLTRMDEARACLLQAIDLYHADGRDWCTEGIALCERLLAAIRCGTARDLLQEWTAHSVAQLRLSKFMRANEVVA